MNPNLKDYLKKNFPNSKSDLFAVFIEKCHEFCKSDGFVAMITQQSFMFLSTFENLRVNLINNYTIIDMTHLGAHAFEEIGGEVVQATSFVNRNTFIENYNSTFHRLTEFNSEKGKEEEFHNDENIHVSKQINYDKIPGSPIVYWASHSTYNHFNNDKRLREFIDYSGTFHKTANNDKYLRYFWEINNLEKNNWRHYNKGGKYRKWYGNNELLVNWTNDSIEYYKSHKTANLFNKKFWDCEGITWTALTSGNFNARYFEKGYISDYKGASIYPKENFNFILGFMNSKVFSYFIDFISPTMDFNIGQVINVPFMYNELFNENLVEKCISISKKYWDKSELSFNFKSNWIVSNNTKDNLLSNILNYLKLEFQEDFNNLKLNEENINEFFINLYELNNVLERNVDEKDISLYVFDEELEIKSFISYAVGCMFGRYSLDKEGLQFAGGDFNINNYHKFVPDDDNIIPVLDSEYFEDDIVGRFVEFVKTCFGEENLEDNLDFIADALAKNKKTSREKIRDYLLKNFFNDHKKTYKKCPIYWQFSSGKQNGFNCLVYMHRYEPSLVARIRTDYLHKTQKAIEQAIVNCDNIINHSSSNSEITKATKDKNKLQKQLKETQEYDEALAHIANQNIEIDLDDGVKVNYAKFQNVEVSGEGKKSKKINLLKKL